MRKYLIVSALVTLLSSSIVFAYSDMDSKACGAIAKACKKAGYAKEGHGKMFWYDCMKPVLLDKSVKNVSVDADTVKECRSEKITELKADLAAFEEVK